MTQEAGNDKTGGAWQTVWSRIGVLRSCSIIRHTAFQHDMQTIRDDFPTCDRSIRMKIHDPVKAFDMTFDTPDLSRSEPIASSGTCWKPLYGAPPSDDALAMWVADMEFRPPQVDAGRACRRCLTTGSTVISATTRKPIWTRSAGGWPTGTAGTVAPRVDLHHPWPRQRHRNVHPQLHPDPATASILMTPVYHAFARIIAAAGREVVECAAGQLNDGRLAKMDFRHLGTRSLTGAREDADPLLAAQSRRSGLDPRRTPRRCRFLRQATT